MFKSRIAIFLGMGALLAVAISGRLMWATTGSGTSSTLLGRGTFEEFKVEREDPGLELELKAKTRVDVATQIITFQPNGNSGWHNHPGPVFITVMSGTMTFYDSGDSSCSPVVVSAGHGFLDAGEHTHIARNETAAPATNVVTYFAPVGVPLRIDQPRPENCPAF